MKRQEICEKTGLTPKALRLYEEKGLINPAKDGLHQKTRDYSQEDLNRLQIIATLRKAMFTLEEIRQMLDEPETIQTIFPQYLSWLRQQQERISELLSASERVDLEKTKTAQDLTDQIERAARNLPIPASDIHFRFRQLDELEAERTRALINPAVTNIHRDAVPMQIDQDHIFVDKRMGIKRMIEDTKDDFSGVAPSGSAGNAPTGPLWLRIIKGILVLSIWLLALSILVPSAWLTQLDRRYLPLFLALIAAILLRVLVGQILKHWKRR